MGTGCALFQQIPVQRLLQVLQQGLLEEILDMSVACLMTFRQLVALTLLCAVR